MKKVLKKIWNWVKDLYDGLVGSTKKYVPIAIKIVEGIKKVMDTPVDDIALAIVTTAIPGDADDKLVKKVKEFVELNLPKFLVELKIINEISNYPDLNSQLQGIITELKKLSPTAQAALWHTFASLAIEKLSDGECTWSDSVVLAEWYYNNIYKEKA